MEYGVGGGLIREMKQALGTQYNPPPLGLWREADYPTTEHSFILSKIDQSVTLLSPALKTMMRIFPVPVTLIENVHQESFWRAIATLNGKTHEMVYSPVGTTVQLDEDGAYRHLRRSLETKVAVETRVEQITALINLNASQRNAIALGENFLKGARAGRKYWDASEQQRYDTGCILEEIRKCYNLSSIRNTRHKVVQRTVFYPRIISLLQDIAKAHWNKVNGLLDLISADTKVSMAAYTSQHADLLVFNRGTREFVRMLHAEIERSCDSSDTKETMHSDIEHLRDILRDFELCYLRIWNPAQLPTYDSIGKEEELHTDRICSYIENKVFHSAGISCQEMLDSLDFGLSWFNTCRLKILYNSIESETPQTPQQRIDILSTARKDLRYMKDEPGGSGGCPQSWVDILKRWIATADVNIGRISPGQPSQVNSGKRRRDSDPNQSPTGTKKRTR